MLKTTALKPIQSRYCLLMLPLFLLLGKSLSHAQSFDLIIRNGHVIDPRNDIDGIMDVAIDDGKIVEVAENITVEEAGKEIDATGLYVTPGLIDIHGHLFWGTEDNAYLSNSYSSLPPDGFTLRSGVTTIVDAGGAGWRNFEQFKEQTIDRSKTRVFAFLNIVGSGMKGGAVEQNLTDMDPKLTAMVARANSTRIVGIKLAHYAGRDWAPTERAVEAGRQADIPVMIDFGGSDPPLPLDTLLLHKLRPGDIFTHCYAHVNGRMPIVNENGKLLPCVLEAQRQGRIFDVGHGGGSFVYEQAVPAIEQGLKPNTISTDLHTGSMNGGMKSMINVMSKILNLGVSLKEVIAASTWTPAQTIKKTELGHLSPGAPADVAILRLQEGTFGFVDVQGWKMTGNRNLLCELTLRDGSVVWDLNGMAGREWEGKRK